MQRLQKDLRWKTKRMLKVRLKEHSQAVKRGDPKNAIAVHAHNTQQASIGWGKSDEEASQLFRRERTVKAIQIKTSEDAMNLKSGLLLPSVWSPTIASLPLICNDGIGLYSPTTKVK